MMIAPSMPLVESVQRCFSFFDTRHPFAPAVQRFREQLVAQLPVDRLTHGLTQGAAVLLRASLKVRPTEHGAWRLKRVSLSFQSNLPTTPWAFHAMTASYSPRRDRLTVWTFPQDPCLDTACDDWDEALNAIGIFGDQGRTLSVLRYVPRYRLTFCVAGVSPESTCAVGKCLRQPVGIAAYDRLRRVSQAVTASSCGFRVARPLALCDRRGVFFQERLPGRALPAVIGPTNYREYMTKLGAVHHELHRLPADGIPEWNVEDFLAGIEEQLDWLVFCFPDWTPALQAVQRALRTHQPAHDPSAYVFCHGDFGCAQVLVDGLQWSVVDFDLCVRADPYWEIAMTIALFPYQLPWLRPSADQGEREHAALRDDLTRRYLEGYMQSASVPIQYNRLRWFRLCAEVTYMSRLLKRDQCHAALAAASMRLLTRLCEEMSCDG